MSKFDPWAFVNIVPNPDGSVTRLFSMPTVPVTGDVEDALDSIVAISKEVLLDTDRKTRLRMYCPTKLPTDDDAITRKLPIVIAAHGGGWILFDASSTVVHETCNRYAAGIPTIIVSVNYRLAPESRLPDQYNDMVDAVLWVKKQAELGQNGDQWLRDHGDFSRCYMYGASNGGNIAFHAALRALNLDLKPLKFGGVILNQPMFGGKQRTTSEIRLAADEYLPLPVMDLMWDLTLPSGSDRDHIFCNPLGDDIPREKLKALGRCLVIGFEGDPMIDRQQDFVQMLILKGVFVEARFEEIGFHAVELIDLRWTTAIVNFIKDFINY